jgi:hypothetical protein
MSGKYNNMAEISETIQQLKQAFKRFAIDEMNGYDEPEIDTWIKNIPSARVYWEGADGIDRNITAYVVEDQEDVIQFEVNAWNDRRDAEGEVRYWQHEDTGVVDLETNDINSAISGSFALVEGLTRSDLENETRIEYAEL